MFEHVSERSQVEPTATDFAQKCVELNDCAPEILPVYIKYEANNLCSIDKSSHTIKNYFTIARGHIQEIWGAWSRDILAEILEHFVLNSEVMADIKGRATVRRQANSIGAFKYDLTEKYIRTVREFCFSELLVYRYVGLIAASGRRPVEMMASNFHVDGIDGEVELGLDYTRFDPDLIGFSGQAKGRNKDKKPYEIPLLAVSAHELVTQLTLGGATMRHLSVKKSNEAFQAFANEVEWPEDLRCSPKNLRAMYACMTYSIFCPEEWQEWYWVNRVLGHEEYDQVTCQAYMRFKVTP